MFETVDDFIKVDYRVLSGSLARISDRELIGEKEFVDMVLSLPYSSESYLFFMNFLKKYAELLQAEVYHRFTVYSYNSAHDKSRSDDLA